MYRFTGAEHVHIEETWQFSSQANVRREVFNTGCYDKDHGPVVDAWSASIELDEDGRYVWHCLTAFLPNPF